MADFYDQDGIRIIPRNSRGGFDFHRYEDHLGKCVCGKDRFHPEHFNGDGNAARIAMDAEQVKRKSRDSWLATLQPGSPVMVSDNHPTPEMQGMVGTVIEVSRGKTKQGLPKDVVQVKFPDRQIGIVAKWLAQPQLPEPPPRFASQEEADQWLEDTAKEMGIRTEPVVPRFETPEEAQEWLDRRAGEPYVPPSWQADPDDANQRIFDLLQKSIAPAGTRFQQVEEAARKGVKGARALGFYMDEAAELPDIVDPYAETS